MVNHFQDERSQQVYSLIDKGRIMQMPFNGMSLLDYAINTTLVMSTSSRLARLALRSHLNMGGFRFSEFG